MPYNDVQPWDYAALPKIFGGAAFSSVVQTEAELEDALSACNAKNKG